MREAIGASWLMIIVLTFVALFSGYLAFSINYSKAFKVKDGIIDRIEKHSGFNDEAINDIADYLNEIGYHTKVGCKNFVAEGSRYVGVVSNSVTNHPESGTYNYCVEKVASRNPSGQMTAAYYKVNVFFSLSLPVFDQFTTFNVTGETINIYYPKNDKIR